MSSSPEIPALTGQANSLISFIGAAKRNFLEVIPSDLIDQPYISFKHPLYTTHFIADPAINRIILRDSFTDYPKSRILIALFRPLIRNSIFITNGKKWQDQHKLAIQTFNWRNVQYFEKTIREITTRELERVPLRQLNKRELSHYFQEMAFEIITHVLFGEQGDWQDRQLRWRFIDHLKSLSRFKLFGKDIENTQQSRIGFGFFRRYMSTVRKLQKIGGKILAHRLENRREAGSDFLEIFIADYDYDYDYDSAPSKAKFNEIVDNILTFLVAGHETSAMTLAWAAYAASYFPRWQAKIGAEAGNPLDQMPHTEAFIMETMRVYPAFPVIMRTAKKTRQFGDLKIKKGQGIIIPTVLLHRHNAHWENPDKFLPGRFLDLKPDPYLYLPFGAGPRVCIGKTLAMMEVKIILGAFLAYYKLDPSTHIPIAAHNLTLRPKNGIFLDLNKRRARNM